MRLSVILIALLAALTTAVAQEPVIHAEVDLAYGPHERHRLDLFWIEGDTQAPLHIWIHGGGWLHSDKSKFVENYKRARQALHAQGIAVAFINYRYAPLPDPLVDAARAVQWLRAHADRYNLDASRVSAQGNSAGGCTALWLATHDDLADPDAEDPIANHSTRLTVAIADNAQTTIDPHQINAWLGEDWPRHPMIWRAGDFDSWDAMMAGYEAKAALYREYSPIYHLSADDPPILLNYGKAVDTGPFDIHHSRFGLHFYKRAQEVGAEAVRLNVRGGPEVYQLGPEFQSLPYLIRHLTDQQSK